MRDMRNFARTDAGFKKNRKIVKSSIKNELTTGKKELKPLQEIEKGHRFSPTKFDKEKFSALRLEKQAHSTEYVDEQRQNGQTSFNFQN